MADKCNLWIFLIFKFLNSAILQYDRLALFLNII